MRQRVNAGLNEGWKWDGRAIASPKPETPGKRAKKNAASGTEAASMEEDGC